VTEPGNDTGSVPGGRAGNVIATVKIHGSPLGLTGCS
jgi:hypothetical protein